MSQTIEEIIIEVQQALNLSEEELNAVKVLASQLSTTISVGMTDFMDLVNDVDAKKMLANKLKGMINLKTSSGALSAISIFADINISIEDGDSLSKAITKAAIKNLTAGVIDTLAALGLGSGAGVAAFAMSGASVERKESKKASKVKSLAPIVPGGCMLKEEKEKSETKSSLSPFTTTASTIDVSFFTCKTLKAINNVLHVNKNRKVA